MDWRGEGRGGEGRGGNAVWRGGRWPARNASWIGLVDRVIINTPSYILFESYGIYGPFRPLLFQRLFRRVRLFSFLQQNITFAPAHLQRPSFPTARAFRNGGTINGSYRNPALELWRGGG